MQIYYSTLCVLGFRLSESLDEMIPERRGSPLS